MGLGAVQLSIEWTVRDWSGDAVHRFGGDRVSALIQTVECDSCAVQDRNHAVWTLATIGDRRALPVVARYYTGGNCRDHRHELCQYELRKAVKRLGGQVAD